MSKPITREAAIEILELKRCFDPNYNNGDKGNIRHFMSHEDDPFTEEEIDEQIIYSNYLRSLPKTEKSDMPIKLNPVFNFNHFK